MPVSDSIPKLDGLPSPVPARKGPLVWGGAVLLLIGLTAVVLAWSGVFQRAEEKAEKPVTAKLTVVIRTAYTRAMLAVDAEGAVPVRSGAGMGLQINFDQPMFAYLLWLD